MRLEQVTEQAIHIMDDDEFLGSFVGPKRTGDKGWQYKPSNSFLTEIQMDEIKKNLKKLNT